MSSYLLVDGRPLIPHSRDLEIQVANAAVKDIKLRSLKSALHSRRKRARKVIEALPEWRELNRLAALVL